MQKNKKKTGSGRLPAAAGAAAPRLPAAAGPPRPAVPPRRRSRHSRGSLVVEVEGDGDALDAGLGAGERHLLVRDDEGRVGRGGGGGGKAEEEEGDEREGPRHGWARARGLGFEGSQLRRSGGGNGSRLACSLASSTGNRATPRRGVTRPVRLHVGPATQDLASSARVRLRERLCLSVSAAEKATRVFLSHYL